MNNGQPPYGDPSQWGQQPGQNPAQPYAPGQYPQQPGTYQQPAAPAGYEQQYGQSQSWQPQTYQPQAHQPQASYQQQSWQPYGQQGGAAQPYQQNAYQQPYQQGSYQQGGYQQGAQSGYPQQPYQQPVYQQPQQNPYQQGMQNVQPLQQIQPQQPAGQYHQAQGYSGYVSAPGDGSLLSAITPEVIVKVALFGLLPVLFLLGVLLPSQPLCWIFLVAAALTVAAMWLKELVDSNLRLISSLLCGVLAVVALVVAINGPADKKEQQGTTGPATQSSQSSTMQGGSVPTWENTPSPTPAVDLYAESGAAAEALQSFFYFWQINHDENMLALTAPSWRAQQADPLTAIFKIRANRTPVDDPEIVSIDGTEQDTVRTAKVKVTISRNIYGRDPALMSFDVVLLKEDGAWYIDPNSLASNEVVATTKATNAMATQPVLNTAQADTVLYYNPDGGSYYHYEANCGKINSRYLPLKGQFLFSQVNDAPYKELEPCTYCGAPWRDR